MSPSWFHVLFFLYNSLSTKLVLLKCAWVSSHLTEHGQPTWCHIPKERGLFLHHRLPTANSSSAVDSPPAIHAGMMSAGSLCRQVLLLWAPECSTSAVFRRHGFEADAQELWLFKPYFPSSLMSPELWGQRCDIDVSFAAEYSTDTCSLRFDKLWVWVSDTVNCKKKFLWWGMRADLIYGYRELFRRQFDTISM